MNITDKQFILFKLFLSLNKVYFNNELEDIIKDSFYNVMNRSYNADDKYYELLDNAIEESKYIYINNDNYLPSVDGTNPVDIDVNNISKKSVENSNVSDKKENIKLLSKYSKHKP